MISESLHATLKLEKHCVKTFFSCLSSIEVPIPIYQKRLKLNHWLNSLYLGRECSAISAWYPLASATVGKAPRVSAFCWAVQECRGGCVQKNCAVSTERPKQLWKEDKHPESWEKAMNLGIEIITSYHPTPLGLEATRSIQFSSYREHWSEKNTTTISGHSSYVSIVHWSSWWCSSSNADNLNQTTLRRIAYNIRARTFNITLFPSGYEYIIQQHGFSPRYDVGLQKYHIPLQPQLRPPKANPPIPRLVVFLFERSHVLDIPT